MTKDHKALTDLEKKVEDEIEQARSELTTVVLAKQHEVVRRIGHALEKIWEGEKRQGICEEIKSRLREEIARRLITTRTIEKHCKPEWKDAQKSRSGRRGAEVRKNALSAECRSAPLLKADNEQPSPSEQPSETIMVAADGSEHLLHGDDEIHPPMAESDLNEIQALKTQVGEKDVRINQLVAVKRPSMPLY